MKKKSITQKSRIDIPIDLDVTRPVSSALFSKICGVNRSSITHGIKSGLIVRQPDGKISLIDNSKYLSQRFSSELVFMDERQSTALQKIIHEIMFVMKAPKPETPETATPEAVEIQKPRPYSPDDLEPETEYSLFIREKNKFVKIAVLYVPADSGASLNVIEPMLFEYDSRGRLESAFMDSENREDLYFSENVAQ